MLSDWAAARLTITPDLPEAWLPDWPPCATARVHCYFLPWPGILVPSIKLSPSYCQLKDASAFWPHCMTLSLPGPNPIVWLKKTPQLYPTPLIRFLPILLMNVFGVFISSSGRHSSVHPVPSPLSGIRQWSQRACPAGCPLSAAGDCSLPPTAGFASAGAEPPCGPHLH